MLLRYLVIFLASAYEAASKGQVVSDWVEIQKDAKHIAREKQKARELRQSQWWRNKIAQGLCAYCQGTFTPDELTMDHIVPLSRGGRSTKGNVVPCCAACNATKKYWTPAELLLQQLQLGTGKTVIRLPQFVIQERWLLDDRRAARSGP